MYIKNGVQTIKKVVSRGFELLEIISPILLFAILLRYLFKEDVSLNDFMWFLFFLVMYGADSIKESKEK
jgi:hypothetical protein